MKKIDKILLQLEAEIDSSNKYIEEYEDTKEQRAFNAGLKHAYKVIDDMRKENQEMKKIIAVLISISMCIVLCSCVGGEYLDPKNNTDYRILINSGSLFVYEIKDADTGVWYICSGKGITPKLNADGSLYTDHPTEGGGSNA